MNIPNKGAGRDGLHALPSNQAASKVDQQSQAGLSGFASLHPIKVLVVDDHPIVRQGLRSCLASCKHLEVVGEAANGKEAIAKTNALMPDVVLMDLEMPTLDGLAATNVLAREQPQVKVLIVSMHQDAKYLKRLIEAGARGYISKEASTAQLIQAIEAVAGGKEFYGSIPLAVTNAALKENTDNTRTKKLSPREQEVLVAISEGLSNKEVGSRLNLGVRTVETHRERIMRKLNIHTVAGLTRYAISVGLVSLSQDRSRDD